VIFEFMRDSTSRRGRRLGCSFRWLDVFLGVQAEVKWELICMDRRIRLALRWKIFSCIRDWLRSLGREGEGLLKDSGSVDADLKVLIFTGISQVICIWISR
jgi:hypothetical protein